MKKRNRIAVALSLVLCLLLGVMASFRVSAAAAPSLFHQDEPWYKDATAGLEIIGGVYYVPVDIFAMFTQIELSMDAPRGEFMVHNRTTDQYISVLYKEKIATVNGEEETYLNLYKLHGGYYYVPAEFFASVLSLKWEVAESSNPLHALSFRLYDGAQQKSFAELLSSYDALTSPMPPVSDTGSDTTVTPPPVTIGEDTQPREVYLTFNSVPEGDISPILRALEEAHARATFFFTEKELQERPMLVVSVLAAGHTLGLVVDPGEESSALLAQAERANAYLYSLSKTRTRILQVSGGSEKAALTEDGWAQIAAAGYVLWDWTYDVPDSVGYRTAYVMTLLRREILGAEVHVLRMSCNDTVAAVLPQLLSYLGENPNYKNRQIRASEAEIYFSLTE